MKKEQPNFIVHLIGEQDLSKLSKDELNLLVEAYLKGLQEYLADKAQKS